MADTWTWDEAACRARLAATPPGEWAHRQTGRADLHNVEDLVECGDLLIAVTPGVGTDRAAIAEFVAHAPADLHEALAEVDRLRARLEECRLVGAGESGAVAELLQLRSERDHWQRKWAEGREEIDRLRAALIRIQEWDCLNPPRQDLLHDLPWLRRLVDEALGAGQERLDLGGASRDDLPAGHAEGLPPESVPAPRRPATAGAQARRRPRHERHRPAVPGTLVPVGP
jgi:hypothetical protein